MAVKEFHRLPRLPDEFYRGHSWVHWTMTIEDREVGWLDGLCHARLREWMCHALGRYRLVCPTYCLMPDHAHFLWIGWSMMSDQKAAAQLFRTMWNLALRQDGRSLQRQAYDHVLRETERAAGAFVATATYILENPVRAGLSTIWREYPYLGSVLPGYPTLDPRDDRYWDVFWRILARVREREASKA